MRDFLGHTNLTTTSRYLRSMAMRLERALRLLEESQVASERTPPMVREGDSRSSATPVPHGAIEAYDVDDALDAEMFDAIELGVVSPEGIDNGKARPPADAVLLMSSERNRSEWNEEW